MSAPIRTLVIDDSAFVRKVVREILAGCPDITVVGTARDGAEALEMSEQLNPQVITCDLRMPKLDGVGFVRRQMARRPVPILILTASPEDAEQVIGALEAGAIDWVRKPTALATEELMEMREELVAKVRAAAQVPVENLGVGIASATLPSTGATTKRRRIDLVALGVSTGGPQALRYLIPEFPADFPVPIVMVLHMPVGYTALFAEKLNEISQLDVREARDGEAVRPGSALLAPAGHHLTLRKERAGRVVCHLSLQPLDKIHRPSVDVLFQSAAELYGSRVLGVVMTGMGDDGKQGAAWIKAQGGTVFTEAEKSCVIYGMPRSVVEAGLSDRAVPLAAMSRHIIEFL